MSASLPELPEDVLNPIFVAAALQDILGVLALAAAGHRAREAVWRWLRAQSTLRINSSCKNGRQLCHAAFVLRRHLKFNLREIYVDESYYSFAAEIDGRDRPLYLYEEATRAAQQLLPLFELGSPRHWSNGILWRVCIYERNLSDHGLEIILVALEKFDLRGLEELYFNHTRLTSYGVCKLAKFINKWWVCLQSLSSIDLKDNPLIKGQGKSALTAAVNKLAAARGLKLELTYDPPPAALRRAASAAGWW